MKPFSQFPGSAKKSIRYVLTDIDDTLTLNGILPAAVFSAFERLQSSGVHIVPITGRPAGWCDHIARMWPVDGVVGENGAFYFRYDEGTKKMIRRYWKPDRERQADRKKLETLAGQMLQQVPGCGISADQAYREADLAVDFCEDVPPIPKESIDHIVRIFENAGATAKISSIHVNGWFGDYDKLSMTRIFFKEIFNRSVEPAKERFLYIGDSPNDCPMFAFFPHSVGVANVLDFQGALPHEPAWVTEKKGGYGFAEMVDHLLAP